MSFPQERSAGPDLQPGGSPKYRHRSLTFTFYFRVRPRAPAQPKAASYSCDDCEACEVNMGRRLLTTVVVNSATKTGPAA
ncbi:hypothetical protein EVAR_3985_1 [Eumeta japonica]|uniref:Uncharacterized protein n=1 Tax=Eumeta variegata TaxID=151549 RepID=A0A4C1SRA4_EUMVA|nr:hypothetical protein EVAR_3985_1 [Eumeta japonica]